MSLFVDREIPVESNSIVVELAWHAKVALLAIGAYSEERGGNVRYNITCIVIKCIQVTPISF